MMDSHDNRSGASRRACAHVEPRSVGSNAHDVRIARGVPSSAQALLVVVVTVLAVLASAGVRASASTPGPVGKIVFVQPDNAGSSGGALMVMDPDGGNITEVDRRSGA